MSEAEHEFIAHLVDVELDEEAILTALVIYWNSEPDAWAGRSSVEEWEQKTFSIYRKAEQRLLADDFIERSIDFDARAELGGIDSYWESVAQDPNIPSELKPRPVVRPPFDGFMLRERFAWPNTQEEYMGYGSHDRLRNIQSRAVCGVYKHRQPQGTLTP